MALVVVAAGGWFGYRELTGTGCSGEVRLTVAVAPEIATAVRDTAADWVRAGGSVAGTCVAVDVVEADAVDVAAVVAGQHGVSLAGVGQASGTTLVPDVWVPDSSLWLQRLSSVASGFQPTNRASIAQSPVVLAMPEPVAATLGWPNHEPTWSTLLQQVATGTRLRTGLVEPGRDAAGLSGLMALARAAGTAGGDAQRATMSALRALATGRSLLRQDLLAKFPRSTDPAVIASSLGAAPLSEEDVIEYNARRPPVALAALYLRPAPMALDYPYAVLPGLPPDRAAAAGQLFQRLTAEQFRARLAARGLRAPDGSWDAGFQAPAGARPATEVPASGAAGGGPDPTAPERA
ncbi:MAG TPA: substrate-binding domain-containing protein, partial [Micromonospora sp.]